MYTYMIKSVAPRSEELLPKVPQGRDGSYPTHVENQDDCMRLDRNC